jgi:hypothetical protein
MVERTDSVRLEKFSEMRDQIEARILEWQGDFKAV